MRSSISALAVTIALGAATPATAADLCSGPACYQAFTVVNGASLLHGENIFGSYIHDEQIGGGYGFAFSNASHDIVTPMGASFHSSAYANLASGSLHVATAQTSATAHSGAKISDWVKFSLPAGMTSATATATWTVEGTNTFIDGVTRARGDFDFYIIRPHWGYLVEFTTTSDAVDYHLTENGLHSITLTQDFTINADDAYQIIASLSAHASPEVNYVTPGGEYLYKNGHSAADYGNTAYFSLTLPEGVGLTSSSGTLLSNPYTPTTPVPEPANWAMMASGLGLLGFLLRRRASAANWTLAKT